MTRIEKHLDREEVGLKFQNIEARITISAGVLASEIL